MLNGKWAYGRCLIPGSTALSSHLALAAPGHVEGDKVYLTRHNDKVTIMSIATYSDLMAGLRRIGAREYISSNHNDNSGV